MFSPVAEHMLSQHSRALESSLTPKGNKEKRLIFNPKQMIPKGNFLRTLSSTWTRSYSPQIGFGLWDMYHGKKENKGYKEPWVKCKSTLYYSSTTNGSWT